MNDIVGINETKVKTTSRTMLEYRTDIKNILNSYTDIIEKTNVYFKGEAADAFRKKYKEFSTNFITINKSFLNYSNDLITLIDSYTHKDNSTIMIDK